MSTNIQFLKSLKSSDNKTDNLLEEKIRENEETIQALQNSINSKKCSNSNENHKNQENIPESSEKSGNKNDRNIKKMERSVIKEEANILSQKTKRNAKENKPTITPLKSKKLKENNNSSISTNINNNTSNTSKINISNNLSRSTNFIFNSDNKISFNNDNKDNSKILNHSKNNFCQNTNRSRNSQISNFNMNNNSVNLRNNFDISQKVDPSVSCQYSEYMPFLSNKKEKKRNKSPEKRTPNRNANYKDKKKSYSMTKIIDEEKFSNAYKRILDKDKKKKEKLEKMKKKRYEQEKKIYIFKPEINKRSKAIISKKKEDFYTRQNRLIEEKNKKIVLLKEKCERKKKGIGERKNKNNKLLSNTLSERDIIKKGREKSVNKVINKLYEWETKRKEKINNKRKIKEKEIENNIMKILGANKKSYIIKVRINNNQIINRLYKTDIKKRKENQEILSKIYTPTFQPLISKNKSPFKISSKKKNYGKIRDNRNNYMGHENKKVNSCKFLTNIYPENINDELDIHCDVDKLIRKRLFSKIKVRYKSAFKSSSVKNGINKNYLINNNNDIHYGRI